MARNTKKPKGWQKKSKERNNTVGIHYELPDGRIAYTYGFMENTIMYYFDDGKGGRSATDAEFQTWTPRRDLRDFPNARDPRLPDEFDTLWDIKYMSELRRVLRDETEDVVAIRRRMAQLGIKM